VVWCGAATVHDADVRYSVLLAAGCCCAAVATHLVAARGATNIENIENIEILNIARKNNAATNINTAN